MTRTLKRFVGGCAALAVAFVGYLFYDSRTGRAAVEDMCALDGGPQIAETVNASGYLDDYDTTGDPISKIRPLADSGYAYIDVNKRQAGKNVLRAQQEAGYYRLTFQDIGDARCIFQAGAKIAYLADASFYGLSAGRCLAVEQLPDRPRGYVYENTFRKVKSPSGPELGLREQRIWEYPSGKTLATNRDYVFGGKLFYWLDMSGGGGRVQVQCPKAQHYRIRSSAFRSDVLRDTTKSSESTP